MIGGGRTHLGAVLRAGRSAALALLIATGACSTESEPAVSSPAAMTVAAEDTEVGLVLSVSADRAEMRTVDRLRVEARLTRPAGLQVVMDPPDWEAAGWTLVDTSAPLARAAGDGRIQETTTVTVEPFLDGTYAIPPFTARWEQNGDGRMVRTGSMEIDVGSVLTEKDGDALAVSLPEVSPSPEAPGGIGLVAGAAAVAFGALVVLWRMTRPRGSERSDGPSAIQQIRSVASGRAPPGEAMGLVHRAIDRLEPPSVRAGGCPGQLDALKERCERARFDRAEGGRAWDQDAEAQMIAADALAVLEGHG